MLPNSNLKVNPTATVEQNSSGLLHEKAGGTQNSDLTLRTINLASQHKLNPAADLKKIAEQIGIHENVHPWQNILYNIITHKSSFGKECRTEFFRGCYETQIEALDKTKPGEIPYNQIQHLGVTANLLSKEAVAGMHLAEKSAWLKLTNQYLCLLRLSENLSQEETECLSHSLTITNKILFEGKVDLVIPQDLFESLLVSVRRFIDDPPKVIFTDILDTRNCEVLFQLADFVGEVKRPELMESFKDVYWQINAICEQLEPESYGGNFAGNDFEEFEENEFQDSDTLMTDEEDVEACGEYQDSYDIESEFDEDGFEDFGEAKYVIEDDIFEDPEMPRGPGFDEKLESQEDDAFSVWDVLHGRVMLAMVGTSSQHPSDNFWAEVLTKNTMFMDDWSIALVGLGCSDIKVVKEFLPKLAEVGIKDSMAAMHLVGFMDIKNSVGENCPNDTAALVVETLKELKREDQREVLSRALQMAHDESEMIEDLEKFKSSLNELSEKLNFKLQT